MRANKRQMHINAYLLPAGHHDGAWRLPQAHAEDATRLSYFAELATVAERGKLDSVFFADGVAMWGHVRHRPAGGLEPLTLLSALAAVTERIGLIATASTSFYPPYNLARLFASIDHISQGRAGWNIVTSTTNAEAENFNLDRLPPHDERYRRASEFIEVVTALWDSWDDDAIELDRENGVYADDAKIHEVNHRGKFYRVRGPLNVPPSPQGFPLLMQAGASEDGKRFATQYADAIFALQRNLTDAQAFYREIKGMAKDFRRDPDDIKVLPGICPILGSTEAEAQALDQRLSDLVVPEYATSKVSALLHVDLSGRSFDDPLPLPGEFPDAAEDGRVRRFWEHACQQHLTIRQVYSSIGRGREIYVGTPEQVADRLAEWFTSKGADGFNVMPPVLPSSLHDFVEQVVPILQKRGMFRSEYTGRTLRENYGLPERRTSRG